MDKDITHIIEKLQKVHLTDNERTVMRQKLLSDMNVRSKSRPVQSPYAHSFSIQSFFKHSYAVSRALAFAFIFSLTGSSLAFAAEQALPGDVLYPIKTQVNENILRAFYTKTPTDRVNFEATIMEKRLVEAEKLEQKQKLNELNKVAIQETLFAQETRVEQAVKKLGDIVTVEAPVANTQMMETSEASADTHVLDSASSISARAGQNVSSKVIQPTRQFVQRVQKIATTTLQKVQWADASEKDQSDSEEAIVRINRIFEKHRDIIEKIKEKDHDTNDENQKNDLYPESENRD